MKAQKELKIGLFVVIILIASFFLINYLRGEDIFNREIELVSRYSDLEGLVESAPVFIKGYKAGKVSEVSYEKESGDFKVTCSVSKDFNIPDDSRMTIYGVDIMGGKGIRIDLGSSSTYAEDGAELIPARESDLISSLSGGILPLFEKVNNTLDSLSITVSGINRILSAENSASLTATIEHLQTTMKNVSAVSSAIGGKSDELSSFISDLSVLSGKLTSVVDKADQTMTGVSSVVSSISETDIKQIITSFKDLLQNINDPDGTVGKLLVDNSVYDSLDELLSDVDTLVRKIQDNPKKYIKISVF